RRSPETRPTSPRLKLVLGVEQLGAAAGAKECPHEVACSILAGECRLRGLLARDHVHRGIENPPPLLIGLADKLGFGFRCSRFFAGFPVGPGPRLLGGLLKRVLPGDRDRDGQPPPRSRRYARPEKKPVTPHDCSSSHARVNFVQNLTIRR